MASDNVLESAEYWANAMRMRDPVVVSTQIAVDLVDALAAEVRALRKDRERLDLIESLANEGRYGWSHAGQHRFVVPHLVHRSQSPEFNTFRGAIDAALSARGGEDGA